MDLLLEVGVAFLGSLVGKLAQEKFMWEIFFDKVVEKWVVSEYSRSIQEGDFTFHFRSQAETSCARRNGLTTVPFWSQGEGDSYE